MTWILASDWLLVAETTQEDVFREEYFDEHLQKKFAILTSKYWKSEQFENLFELFGSFPQNIWP